MQYSDVLKLLGQRVDLTIKQEKVHRGKLVWAHPVCVNVAVEHTTGEKAGYTVEEKFFLDEITSVVVLE